MLARALSSCRDAEHHVEEDQQRHDHAGRDLADDEAHRGDGDEHDVHRVAQLLRGHGPHRRRLLASRSHSGRSARAARPPRRRSAPMPRRTPGPRRRRRRPGRTAEAPPGPRTRGACRERPCASPRVSPGRLAVNPAEEVRLAAKIVPRWEWRTFGNDFGAAEDTLGGLAVERAEESDDLYLLFRDGDATVKVRNGVLDVKGLLAVDDDGLEQWVPVGKHPFPVSRDDLAAALARLGVVAPPLDRETYTAEQLLDEVVPADRRAASRHGAQAARPLHGRRRDGRALRAPDRRGLHALARDRVRGPRARAGGGPLARPRGARERVHGPRAEGADELRAGALRGHRRRHQLGQAPRRRAPRRRHVERGRRPRDRHPARRGPRRDRRPRARADGPDAGRDRGAGRGGARGRCGRDRRRRHRGAARRDERRRLRRRRRGSLRRPDRDHPRRGGGPPRLPRGHDGARPAPRLARGLRHRRRQLAVHLR